MIWEASSACEAAAAALAVAGGSKSEEDDNNQEVKNSLVIPVTGNTMNKPRVKSFIDL